MDSRDTCSDAPLSIGLCQENGELINLLDGARSLLSMRDPSCLIGLLAFILRYVIPVWVLPLRDEDQARWLDDLVGPRSPR
jgi:hypothetical protein